MCCQTIDDQIFSSVHTFVQNAIATNTMNTFYKVEINKTEWEVPERYQNLTPVGSGAYGQVW